MRFVRVRLEKPLPAFGSVEYREPEYSIAWLQSHHAVTIERVKDHETWLVPWNRVVEAQAYPQDCAAFVDEPAPEPKAEEFSHETRPVDKRRRRR